MKQADVPTRADGLKEFQQRPRALRKFEPVQTLVREAARLTAHHVAHVQFGHFVVGHVAGRKARCGNAVEQSVAFSPALREREPDKNLRRLQIAVPVVELRNAAPAQKLAEPQKRTRHLGNLDGKQRLALRAQIRPLGDVPKAIEIHVGAAIDCNESARRAVLSRYVFLDARNRQRARRFGDGASILKNILNGGADLIRRHQDDLIHILTRQSKGFLAHPPHRDTVGEHSDAVERHAFPGPQGLVHCRRIFGLHPDDPDARVQRLRVRRDAGYQAAAADRHENGVDLVAMMLAQNLHGDRALSGDDVGIIKGVDEHQPALPAQFDRVFISLIVVIAVQHDLSAEISHRLHFDVGSGHRHDDDGRNAACARAQCHALRMIAGGRANDTSLRADRRQLRDLVVRAANLERKHRLEVFSFEHDAVAEPARQPRCGVQRCFDGNVVHLCLEDAFYVVFLHGRGR